MKEDDKKSLLSAPPEGYVPFEALNKAWYRIGADFAGLKWQDLVDQINAELPSPQPVEAQHLEVTSASHGDRIALVPVEAGTADVTNQEGHELLQILQHRTYHDWSCEHRVEPECICRTGKAIETAKRLLGQSKPTTEGRGWMPIAAAPKIVKQRILAWVQTSPTSGHEEIVYWNGAQWVDGGGPLWAGIATQWQPLPPPPTQEKPR